MIEFNKSKDLDRRRQFNHNSNYFLEWKRSFSWGNTAFLLNFVQIIPPPFPQFGNLYNFFPKSKDLKDSLELKIWAGPLPPFPWAKSKRTAVFPQENVSKIRIAKANSKWLSIRRYRKLPLSTSDPWEVGVEHSQCDLVVFRFFGLWQKLEYLKLGTTSSKLYLWYIFWGNPPFWLSYL